MKKTSTMSFLSEMLLVAPLLGIFSGGEASLLFEAVLEGNRSFVKRLVECKAADVNDESVLGLTSLMQASNLGKTAMVELLLDYGADINARHLRNGWTSLMYAAARGWPDTVHLLLSRGADYELADFAGNTALTFASNTQVKQLLLNKLRLRRPKKPMKRARMIGHGDIQIEFNFVGNSSDAGMAFLSAVVKGSTPLVKSLIEAGANVNYQNPKGMTALMVASYHGYGDIVKMLLVAQAEVNRRCGHGWTALMYAVSKNKVKVAKKLIANGADVNSKSLTNCTPIMLAAMESVEMTNLLITKGARIKDKDANGATAVYYASETRNIGSLKLLVTHGASVDPRKGDGSTPLMFAVARGDLPTTKALLELGAEVNAKKSDNSTPLMYAAHRNDFKIVKLLVDFYQADVRVRNQNGNSALQFATDDDVKQLIQSKLPWYQYAPLVNSGMIIHAVSSLLTFSAVPLCIHYAL